MPTYEEIKHKCVLNNVLWEDPDFHANSDAILPDLGDKDSYTWKRPKVCRKSVLFSEESLQMRKIVKPIFHQNATPLIGPSRWA